MEPVPNFDPYVELEVSRTATTPTIDAAWRSLLKRNHPDIGGPRAAERTVRLNIAHDWLSDPVRRARYDESRDLANRKRAEASAARQRARPPSAAGPAPAARRPTSSTGSASGPTVARAATSGPTPSRAAWTRAAPSRSKVGRQAHPQGARIVGGRSRVLLIAAAAITIVGAIWLLPSVTGPGAGRPAAAVVPTGTSAVIQPGLLPGGSSAQGSTALNTPATTSEPSDRRPPASEPIPAISLSGGGNRPATRLQIVGGTYTVDYVVSSAAGASCPWAIFLTDSSGLDLLMASAYPVDETVRNSQRDSGVIPGPGTIRVESDCPRWSATITRTGP